MSAIAGQVRFDHRPADSTGLEKVLENLTYRGPDSSGQWVGGPAVMGARLLWSTPESLHERQPLVDAEAGLALVADARLDNREELLPILGLSYRSPGDITDSELVLNAFKKWGPACPEQLVGDFAFAVWDVNRHELFCARDPMGLKPLYYYHSPGRAFIFASQVRPLFSLPDVPRRLNEVRIADHIGYLLEDRENTFYQEIFQLPAGHCLSVDGSGLRLRRYWDLDPRRELRMPSDEAYAEAFLEVFVEAVRCRLRSAYPLGSLLSGGLDSSSIVAVARQALQEQGGGPLHTFSAVFPTLAQDYPRIDERPWIEAVVAQGGLHPHYVVADELDPLEAITFDADEPLPIPNFWLDWGCFRAAHEAGVRVVLSGYDGDSAISYGYGYLAELALAFHWRTLLDEARIRAGLQNKTARRVLKLEVLRMLAPPAMKTAWGRLRGHPLSTSPYPFEPLVDQDFARRIKLHERALSMDEAGFEKYVHPREIHRQGILSGLMLLGPELFDKAGAAWGLEARLPFFDRRLLEFALALPTRQKGGRGWNRYVVRRAMEGLLPPEVQWRRGKGNLSPNVRRGFLEGKASLDEEIFGNLQEIRGYMDVPAVQAAYQRFLTSPMNSADSDIFAILVAVTLARWLRTAFSPEVRHQLLV